MTTGTLIELQANLKALNLSSIARNLEGSLRQARESGISYDEFLIEMTTTELQAGRKTVSIAGSERRSSHF